MSMSIDLLVGCPVYHREWILDYWWNHVERSCYRAGITPGYAFLLDRRDRNSELLLREKALAFGRTAELLLVDEGNRAQELRNWTSQDRLEHMVWIRNKLLNLVRQICPLYFLSVDSDILLHPDAVKNLLETGMKFDAVGGRTYMDPVGVYAPSYANISGNGHALERPDYDGILEVQVIMALKLMGPEAYLVDYSYDDRGEDIGWSLACAEAGLSLGWDGRVVSKHVMFPWMLEAPDPRCGF